MLLRKHVIGPRCLPIMHCMSYPSCCSATGGRVDSMVDCSNWKIKQVFTNHENLVFNLIVSFIFIATSCWKPHELRYVHFSVAENIKIQRKFKTIFARLYIKNNEQVPSNFAWSTSEMRPVASECTVKHVVFNFPG